MKKLFAILSIFLCCACEMPAYQVTNLYYDNVYLGQLNETGIDNLYTYERGLKLTFADKSRPFASFGDFLPLRLDIYQDADMQCLLFSYTRHQMQSNKTPLDGIYTIIGDRMLFADNKTYKNIKKTSHKHIYNPQLCKRKPTDKELKQTIIDLNSDIVKPDMNSIIVSDYGDK